MLNNILAEVMNKKLDYAKNNLHREMSFDKLSFNLIGVTLENFALSESSTFQEGTFVKADKFITFISHSGKCNIFAFFYC